MNRVTVLWDRKEKKMGKVFKKYLKERIIDFIAYISEYMYGIISYLLIVGGMAIILNKVSFGNKILMKMYVITVLYQILAYVICIINITLDGPSETERYIAINEMWISLALVFFIAKNPDFQRKSSPNSG